MAKNHQSDNPLFKALVKKYESDIASGFATMIIYFDSSVGIGEHPQFIEEMDKQLEKILIREKRFELYKDTVKFIKTRVNLDLASFKDDIWSH